MKGFIENKNKPADRPPPPSPAAPYLHTPAPPFRCFDGPYAALLTYVQNLKGRRLGDGEIIIIMALARDGSGISDATAKDET